MSEPATPQQHAPRGPLKTRQNLMGTPNPMKQGRITCKATNRQGNRCGKPPIPGGAVCRMHGGAAPQVKNAADARLRELEMPALNRIASLIEQTEFPSVAYQASKDILDRVRGRATEVVEAKITNLSNLTDEQLRAKALELARGDD